MMKIWESALILFLLLFLSDNILGVTYTFKRYTYKKKRDDKKYRNAKTVCDLNQDCLKLYGVLQTACIRRCVSKFCYEELYESDPLEEGEIDVRFNSYKGCLAQEKRNENNLHNTINLS